MKLKKLMACILLGVMLLSLVSCGLDKNLESHFDTWASEKNENIHNVWANQFVYLESGKIDLCDYVADKIFLEVFLEQDGVLYFCYADRVESEYPRQIWNLASLNLATGEERVLFSDELSSVEKAEGYEYSQLAYCSNRDVLYGGLYENGKIFLKGSEKIIAYSITDKTVQEIASLPTGNYSWDIIDQKQSIVIEDLEQGVSRTITLSDMANINDYAKELLALSKEQIWDGTSCSQKLFSKVKAFENNLYLICELLNWSGEAYVIIFRYDLLQNQLFYLDYFKTNDSANGQYSFISSLEK